MRTRIAPLLLLLLTAPALAQETVKAKMTWITDFRHQKAEKPKPPAPGPAKGELELDLDMARISTLSIGLDLEGAVLATANARGDLVFKVTDDKGNALASLKEEVRRQPGEYLPLGVGRDPNRYRLELNSLSPARAATKVSIEGKVTLLTGKVADVVVPGVTKLIGKKVDHKDLKAAGLEITVKSIETNPGIEGTQVFFEIKGKFRHLAGFELLDEKDKVINSGGDEYFEIGLPPEDRAWPALIFAKGRTDHEKLKLRVRVLLDAKDTVVPFALKDIPLP